MRYTVAFELDSRRRVFLSDPPRTDLTNPRRVRAALGRLPREQFTGSSRNRDSAVRGPVVSCSLHLR